MLGAFTVGEGARIGSMPSSSIPSPPAQPSWACPAARRARTSPTKRSASRPTLLKKSDDPYSVAIKELVRVTHEQNAVIEKLSEQIRELGGKASRTSRR